jgi:hypothetical protein|nr:MAG TPA: hypothetical protein [Caudoviricetes sp.]
MTTWKIFYWLTHAAIIAMCIIYFEDKREKSIFALATFAAFSLFFTLFEATSEI